METAPSEKRTSTITFASGRYKQQQHNNNNNSQARWKETSRPMKPPRQARFEPKNQTKICHAWAHLCLQLEVPEQEVGHLLVVTRPADEKQRQLRQPAAAAAPALAPLRLASGRRCLFFGPKKKTGRIDQPGENGREGVLSILLAFPLLTSCRASPNSRSTTSNGAAGGLRPFHHWLRVGPQLFQQTTQE